MANEATVRTSLTVRKTNADSLPILDYQSRPTTFQATVTGTKGPTPGAVAISTDGTDISLAELTTPGLVRVMNMDGTNYVQLGIHDGSIFHPFMELLPGESYVFRFARDLGEEHTVAGTGTTATVNTFHAKANTAACVLLVEAFEL